MMEKCAYFGNPWIGMFLKTNDDITLLPLDSMEKVERKVKENLLTRPIRVTMGDSNLLGVYVTMNSRGMVLPNVVREEEVALLRSSGLEIYVSQEKNNAHGNNIVINDKGGIVNPHVANDEIKKMEEVLGIELVPMKVAGYATVGSACLATNSGFLAHYRASEEELRQIQDALKVEGGKGTVNTGTGFVSYGVVVNKNGYLAGENTTAYELGRVEEALGLIK